MEFGEEVLSIEGGSGVGTINRDRTRLGGVTGVQEWRIVEHQAPRQTVRTSTRMGMDARLRIAFAMVRPKYRKCHGSYL